MKRGVTVSLLVVGAVIGGASVAAFHEYAARPVDRPAKVGPTHQLQGKDASDARILLGKLADTLVASQRTERPGVGFDQIAFFGRPTSAGDKFCEVRRYNLIVARGSTPSFLEGDDNPVRVATTYGFRPAAANGALGDCGAFTDFANLIAADGPAELERALTELEDARRQAKNGQATFEVSCRNMTGDGPLDCDGLAHLKEVEPRTVRQMMSWADRDQKDRHVDVLNIGDVTDDCDNPDFYSYEIKSLGKQEDLNPGTISSVSVSRGAVC